MTENIDTDRDSAVPNRSGTGVSTPEVVAWFVREVLPLEAILMHFLRHNWRGQGDFEDLRQDVYVRVCEAAQKELPEQAKPFVLMTARNLLVDRIRREQIVPIEVVSDIDALGLAMDTPSPERTVLARDELRHVRKALDDLPPRAREAVVLGRIEGLSGREIAARMGIAENTVSEHLSSGIRILADMLHGKGSTPRRDL
jgi:RNA polymerase sigma factor (sigma-70 family)